MLSHIRNDLIQIHLFFSTFHDSSKKKYGKPKILIQHLGNYQFSGMVSSYTLKTHLTWNMFKNYTVKSKYKNINGIQ